MLTNWNNKVLYVGVTNDLIRRISEHKSKVVKGFTQKYNLTKLVYFEEFRNINDAIENEKKIKGWLRIKKDELVNQVNPNWEDLSLSF
jgi:putative endonuclease